MSHFRCLLTSTAFVALATAAAAAPATQEGADELTGVFQSYFGSMPGVVTVSPAGDIYRMVIDLGPLTSMIPASEFSLAISPLNYELTDLGDGTWNVTQNQPITVKASVPNELDYSIVMGSVVGEGVWDEKIETFSSYTSDVTGFSSSMTATDGGETVSQNTTTAKMHTVMTSTPGANGGADSLIVATAEGYALSMDAPMGPGMPPMNIAATADTQNARYEIKGARNAAMLDIVAWAVANAPAPEAIPGKQEELRALLQSSLPIFENLSGTADINTLTVQSPIGVFSADTLGVEVEMSGGVADGLFREAISLSGLVIPPGIAPPWAEQLVPTEARFDVKATNFNLADPLAAIVSSFDMTSPDGFPPGFEMTLLGSFMPTGAVDVTILPTSVSNSIYSVSLEGVINAGLMGAPTGSGTVTATGMDQVQQVLQSAPPEIAGQVLMPLGMATGMAKPGPDGALIWEIDGSQPGKLLVNGVDLMAMGMQ